MKSKYITILVLCSIYSVTQGLQGILRRKEIRRLKKNRNKNAIERTDSRVVQDVQKGKIKMG